MVGEKIYKDDIDYDKFNDLINWSNQHNAVVIDKGDYYECINTYNAINEPTKAEKIADIKKYYDARFETLEQMVLRRRLINGDITDLQDQYKKLNLEMLAKIKAVK